MRYLRFLSPFNSPSPRWETRSKSKWREGDARGGINIPLKSLPWLCLIPLPSSNLLSPHPFHFLSFLFFFHFIRFSLFSFILPTISIVKEGSSTKFKARKQSSLLLYMSCHRLNEASETRIIWKKINFTFQIGFSLSPSLFPGLFHLPRFSFFTSTKL